MPSYSKENKLTLQQLTKSLLKDNSSSEKTAHQLREVLRFHEYQYYVLDEPLISDKEYDQLYQHLSKLETEHPAWITSDSPTQRIGSDLSDDQAVTAKHLTPMLSLDNSYNAEDLTRFDESIKKLIGYTEQQVIEYAVEPKFDGGTVVLLYEGDTLIQAATRGNGEEGEVITNNIKTIKTIPLHVAFSARNINTAELRGEAIIKKSVFEEINQARIDDDLPAFANPRNAATGGLRMKDPKESAERGLEAFIFQLSYIDAAGKSIGDLFEGHFQTIEALGQLGFKVPSEDSKLCQGIDEVVAFAKQWEARRDKYPYEVDGLVVKVNNYKLQAICGATSHHPRWAIAYKFKAKQATTILKDIEYQVGKVGSITPVAKLEPVPLAGVTVSSVSLHNEDFITSKDIRIGDTVLVERAGDVIPYIVKSFPELRDGSQKPVEFPAYCPINTTEKPVKLVREGDEAAWRCPTCVCGVQDRMRVIFHVSKTAMNIDGFGKALVERFMDLGWIKDIADVYHLDYDAVAELDGYGTKSAQNLKKSIEKAKLNPIHRLLNSLSIHHLGQKGSKLIAAEIEHVMQLREWTTEQYLAIKDVGPILAENMVQYFNNPANIDLLKRMESYGVNLKALEEDKPIAIKDDAPLAGKTILFTGTLTQMSRDEAKHQAILAGAKPLSAVSKNLDILVIGEKAGSKLGKAKKIETIKIWTEEEFLEQIKPST